GRAPGERAAASSKPPRRGRSGMFRRARRLVAYWKKRCIAMCRPPGRSTVAVVGDVNVIVIIPSLPTRLGATNAHEMHWPPVYLSSVAVNTLLVSAPAARYHCDAPLTRYE